MASAPKTFTEAKIKLAVQSMMLSKTNDGAEFRVCPRGSCEATAYYTDDLEDAYGTGIAMAKQMGLYREPLLDMA